MVLVVVYTLADDVAALLMQQQPATISFAVSILCSRYYSLELSWCPHLFS